MEPTSTASTKFALCLLVLLFVVGVYRAATCDVTPSEAWNYDRYISPTWQESLQHFDLNNHFLNTILVRISTYALGRKEIALRLPSLLAGLLYGWAVWRLARRVLGHGWGFAVAIALLTLNPLLVDAFSEARGYGMAMAGWLWALNCILVYLEELDRRKLNQAAMCLALSMAACLTFVVPALGLAVAATWRIRRPAFRQLWLPMLVFLFVLLVIPLNRALLSDFAAGANSLRQTLAELTASSLGALPVNGKLLAGVLRFVTGLMLSAAVLIVLRRGKSDPILWLTTGTAVIGFLILLVAHAWIKSPFPQQGAIYFVPILSLVGLALFCQIPRLMLPLAAACVLIYAAGFPAGPYLEAGRFQGSRELAKAIRADAGQRPARVAASLELEPVMNYYRTRYRQGNWERIERKAPEPGYEYYALTAADAPLVEILHLHVMRRWPGMILAAR